LKAVTAPEFVVPIETSHGPVPHSASPAAHAAVVATISAWVMVEELNPLAPPLT